jgi:hypothetical protein
LFWNSLLIQFPNHFAGFPTANELSGISWSPQNLPNNTAFPIVIPGHITVLPPIQQSPMVMVRRFPDFSQFSI